MVTASCFRIQHYRQEEWASDVTKLGLGFCLAQVFLQVGVRLGCGFHAIRTLSPRTSGHSFHAHSDRQSERSDAGLHC
ncbi:hypothetical protein F7R20_02625 [Pseudomonas brassicacearum subsp. brassicacearum]|nr:hypothetical protein F7R20_02625 [Pseudomonas brassicacearum subsp. brassicacearum]